MTWPDVAACAVAAALLFGLGFGVYSCEMRTQDRVATCISAGREPLQCRAALRGSDTR